MAYLEYFDQRAIDFNSEVMRHPELMEKLARHTDPTMKLAHVAAYCGVILDGAYSEEDCNVLCKVLTDKLIAKRTAPSLIV
jgi:hypothetical protein